jgi:hypothetical protein
MTTTTCSKNRIRRKRKDEAAQRTANQAEAETAQPEVRRVTPPHHGMPGLGTILVDASKRKPADLDMDM